MKSDKEWYEGFKWAESVFKEMYFDEALEFIFSILGAVHYANFDKGAYDYCDYVQRNIEIFLYRFNDKRFVSQH